MSVSDYIKTGSNVMYKDSYTGRKFYLPETEGSFNGYTVSRLHLSHIKMHEFWKPKIWLIWTELLPVEIPVVLWIRWRAQLWTLEQTICASKLSLKFTELCLGTMDIFVYSEYVHLCRNMLKNDSISREEDQCSCTYTCLCHIKYDDWIRLMWSNLPQIFWLG